MEALDVLSDEEQRRVYDKCRDYMVGRHGRVLEPTACNVGRQGRVREPTACPATVQRWPNLAVLRHREAESVLGSRLHHCTGSPPSLPPPPPQGANPGRGLPALSPEEAALMRSGAAELSRLRRMGAKAVKHAPLEMEVRGGHWQGSRWMLPFLHSM